MSTMICGKLQKHCVNSCSCVQDHYHDSHWLVPDDPAQGPEAGSYQIRNCVFGTVDPRLLRESGVDVPETCVLESIGLQHYHHHHDCDGGGGGGDDARLRLSCR